MIRNSSSRLRFLLIPAAFLAVALTFAADTIARLHKTFDFVIRRNLIYKLYHAAVCGEVTGAKYSGHRKRKPTFLDFGPPHPNQVFTALIWGEYRDRFDYVPESLIGQTICVSSTITEYKGKAEI